MTLRRITTFKEADLYEPLQKWLVNQGYEVQAEVKSCDVIAIKDDEMTIIELKKSFNLQLVYQCLDRQKMAKYVYATIALPPKGKKNKKLKEAINLLKRLGIGLMIIHMYDTSSYLEVLLEAKPSTLRINKRKKKGVLKEIEKRTGNYNVGGKAGKIISSYRESAIHIFCLLQKIESGSPAQLIKLGAPPNTGNILRDNHYEWFHKKSRGLYTFDADFKSIEKSYPNVVEFFMDHIKIPIEDD